MNNIEKITTIYPLNLIIRHIESDGNCYFRAVSDQLSGSQDGHIILRLLLVDFMSDNREVFERIVDSEYFSSWDHFIDRMNQNGTFADITTVVASSMLFRRQVIIHQDAQRPMLFKSSSSITNKNQIHLGYDSKALHYHSLYTIDGNKLSIEESECTHASILPDK